jgi:predicted DNA-binding protein
MAVQPLDTDIFCDKTVAYQAVQCTAIVPEAHALAAPKMAKARSANLTLRLNPDVRETLNQLSAREGATQTALLERLITTAWENPEGYYLRAAAINSFTAAALSRIVLGIVAAEQPRLLAALEVVDKLSRGMFGPLPPVPPEAAGFDGPDERIAALLEAFGDFDPAQ